MTQPADLALMFEVLKSVQADVAAIKQTVNDHTRLLVLMREDDLRQSLQAETQLRLDRIESRLTISDAE